jgi:hypothetical protein
MKKGGSMFVSRSPMVTTITMACAWIGSSIWLGACAPTPQQYFDLNQSATRLDGPDAPKKDGAGDPTDKDKGKDKDDDDGSGVKYPKASSILVHILRIEFDFEDGPAQSIDKDKVIDLIQLKDDVLKTLDITLPVDKMVTRIRLVTAESGHKVFSTSNQEICRSDIKIPSGPSSGIKLVFRAPGLKTEAGKSYTIIMLFDAKDPLKTLGHSIERCMLSHEFVVETK